MRGIYDTTNRSGGKAASDAGRIVEGIRYHPHLRVTSSTEVTVNGAHGIQLDVAVVSAPVRRPQACSVGCAYLFRLDDGDAFWVWKGNNARISVLRTVEWEPAPNQTR